MQRYGISEADAARMLAEQNGLCAACRQRPARHVDHDHASGKVRALLCFTCNVALGNVGDSVERLERLVAYLRAHRTTACGTARPARVTARIPSHCDYRLTLSATRPRGANRPTTYAPRRGAVRFDIAWYAPSSKPIPTASGAA